MNFELSWAELNWIRNYEFWILSWAELNWIELRIGLRGICERGTGELGMLNVEFWIRNLGAGTASIGLGNRQKEEQEMKTGMRLNDGMRDFLTPLRGHQGRTQACAPYRSPVMTATERWWRASPPTARAMWRIPVLMTDWGLSNTNSEFNE